MSYQLNAKNSFYGYFGIANKEPRRDDYESGAIKPERLFDYELGWKYNTKNVKLYANAFYMRYNNQLVMTGALNDVGSPIFTNSGKSYRLGLEVEAKIKPVDKWILQPNITISQNKNEDFYFQRDGVVQNLGNTNIAYSPNLIFANSTTYMPVKNLNFTLLTKFVGKQYLGNIDSKQSVLDYYTNTDLNISYDWKINRGIKSIVFSGLINNFFDEEYESNGYFYTYDDDSSGSPITYGGAGFYPQAGINFLLGLSLKF